MREQDLNLGPFETMKSKPEGEFALNYTNDYCGIGWLREQDLNLGPFETMKSEPKGEFALNYTNGY